MSAISDGPTRSSRMLSITVRGVPSSMTAASWQSRRSAGNRAGSTVPPKRTPEPVGNAPASRSSVAGATARSRS